MKYLTLISFLFCNSFLLSQGDYMQLTFIDSLTHTQVSNSSGFVIFNDVDTIQIKTNTNGLLEVAQPDYFIINEILLFTNDSTKCKRRNEIKNLNQLENIELFCTLSSVLEEKVSAQAKNDIKSCNAQIYVDPYSIVKMNSIPDTLFSNFGFRYTSSNMFEYSENKLTWQLLVIEYNSIIHEYLSIVNGHSWKKDLIESLQLK